MTDLTLGGLVVALSQLDPTAELNKAVIRMRPPQGMGVDVIYSKPKFMRDPTNGSLCPGQGAPLGDWVDRLRRLDLDSIVWMAGLTATAADGSPCSFIHTGARV